MVKNFLLCIFAALLISCGASKRVVHTDQSKVLSEKETTVDSSGVKKASESQVIVEDRQVDTKVTSVEVGEDWKVTLTPPTDGAPQSEGTVKTVITTPKGTYTYETPKNYKVDIEGGNSEKTKTETGKETGKKQETVDKKSEESAKVSRETSSKDKSETKTRDSDREKSEPIWFNVGFYVFLLILIAAGFIYWKINTK